MSREIVFLETELFRLELEHSLAPNAEARQALTKQILKHCRRLGQLEAMGDGSDRIRPDEWFQRYSRAEAGAAPAMNVEKIAHQADPLFAASLEKQVESLSAEPFDPGRYIEKKARIEALMRVVIEIRDASPTSDTLAFLLARLWEISVREDDAHEIVLRTARQT